jgi:uncharacterized protein YndB with AHSA1/START domain
VTIDPTVYVGAVTRVVENRERDGRPARAVIATRSYDTDIADLWDALTNAERIPRWFMPISGELRLGGRYQLHGNAGGTITECEPPKHLAVTWEFGEAVTWVTVTLSRMPKGGTRLQLEHVAHIDPHWGQYGPGAVGVGWDLGIYGLARHIETGEAVATGEGLAFLGSPVGKAFVNQSSADWGRADIAGGEDPAVATASAERTRAAYTGGGDPG